MTKFFSSGWRREGHPHFTPQTPTTVNMFLASRMKWGNPATGPGQRQRETSVKAWRAAGEPRYPPPQLADLRRRNIDLRIRPSRRVVNRFGNALDVRREQRPLPLSKDHNRDVTTRQVLLKRFLSVVTRTWKPAASAASSSAPFPSVAQVLFGGRSNSVSGKKLT